MITHLVFFKVRGTIGEAQHEHEATELVKRLNGLAGQIPSLITLKAGRDFSATPASYDVGLYTTFADKDGLEAYRIHPDHQAVVKFVQEVTTARAVVDFE